MNKSKKIAVIPPNACVACGCCVKVCPISAIQIWNGTYAWVDTEKCVGCGKCTGMCPASIIGLEARQ